MLSALISPPKPKRGSISSLYAESLLLIANPKITFWQLNPYRSKESSAPERACRYAQDAI